MTDRTPRYELAMLRLEAWKALDGWDVRKPNATELIDTLIQPWDWPTRMKKADELVAWALKSSL